MSAPVRYRSLAGDVWDALLVREGPPGFVDIDVLIPGVKEPWHLRAVRRERIEAKIPAAMDGTSA